MGLERPCQAHINGRRVEGVAHLDATELRFAGKPTLRIPLGAGVRARAVDGELVIDWTEGSARFDLGADAEKWALKIRYPRGRLDKLGITPDSIVSIVRVPDPAFEAEVRARTPQVTVGRLRAGTRVAVVGVTAVADLDRLTADRQAIAESGAIWVVWIKGRKALTETHVREAAKAQGLVNVKVMSFSDELSGLKLVIPVAQRARSTGR